MRLKHSSLLPSLSFNFLLLLEMVLLNSQQFSISGPKPDSQILLGTGATMPSEAEKRVKKDEELLESVQQRVMRMVRGLEHLP